MEWLVRRLRKRFSHSFRLPLRVGGEHHKSLSLLALEDLLHPSRGRRIESEGGIRMGASVSAVRLRTDLHTRLVNARARTDELFGIVRQEALYDRPIIERHRIIFYVGHVEAFDWNLLAQRALGLPSFHPSFDKLFAFGIDPLGGGLPTDERSDWPGREEIEKYNRRLRRRLDEAIEHALTRPWEAHPQLVEMLEAAAGRPAAVPTER